MRTGRPGIIFGTRDGTDPDDVSELARIRFGDIEGVIMGIPMLPDQLQFDQERALRAMERAVQLAGPVQFVGLGSALAAVAGRGSVLEAACGIPVTTGNAATAWAAVTVARRVANGRPIAVLGGKGAVGRVIAEMLGAAVDPPDLAGFAVVVGAHTTGGVLAPEALGAGTTLVDVALPPTLSGRAMPGTLVLPGESVALAPGWRRNAWGWCFHLVAGYGLQSVYACLLEPLIALQTGRSTPFAQGRMVRPDAVVAFGVAAEAAGFRVRSPK